MRRDEARRIGLLSLKRWAFTPTSAAAAAAMPARATVPRLLLLHARGSRSSSRSSRGSCAVPEYEEPRCSWASGIRPLTLYDD